MNLDCTLVTLLNEQKIVLGYIKDALQHYLYAPMQFCQSNITLLKQQFANPGIPNI